MNQAKSGTGDFLPTTITPMPGVHNAVHTEDGIGFLQMENQLAVPGDG
tara:strand:+ start:316 stop:459 length:144 start_codon:yes stop_codon:yes gene_type:complete